MTITSLSLERVRAISTRMGAKDDEVVDAACRVVTEALVKQVRREDEAVVRAYRAEEDP